MRAYINAPSTREVVFTRNGTEALNLVAYAWGLDNLGPGDVVVATELEHHSNFVPWQYMAQRAGAEFAVIPIDDQGELVLDALSEIEKRGRVKVVACGARLEHARDDQPDRRARGLGARPRSDLGGRRVSGCSAPSDRRAGARLRLPRSHGSQDARAERDRRTVGAAGAAPGHGAVRARRLDDPARHGREDDLGRAALQVRGRHSTDRRGIRARGGRRLSERGRPPGDRASRAAS